MNALPFLSLKEMYLIRLISFCWGQIALDIFIIEGLPNCSADWMFNIKLLNVCQGGSFASTYDGDDDTPVCVCLGEEGCFLKVGQVNRNQNRKSEHSNKTTHADLTNNTSDLSVL